MDQVIKTFDKALNAGLDTLVNKTYFVRGLVHLLIILYATKMAPELPKQVMDLFENQYFKLFVFSLILWTAQFSPSTSILLALAFMMTVNYSMKRPLWEMMENVDQKQEELPSPPEAVVALANAAASEEAAPKEKVEEAAQIAGSAVKTEEGADAVVALAQQAMAPEAGETVQVQEAAQVAVDSMVPQPAPAAPGPAPAPIATAPAEVKAGEGCYPMRRYDLSQLSGYNADNNYGEFSL
jgi:hypothetical protein